MRLHFNSKEGKINHDFNQSAIEKVISIDFFDTSIKREDISKIQFEVRFEFANGTISSAVHFTELVRQGYVPKNGFEIAPVTISPDALIQDQSPIETLKNVSIKCMTESDFDFTVDVNFNTVQINEKAMFS